MEEKKKAVALNYNEDKNAAPVVLTKASGDLAKFLLEQAVEQDIEIIEDAELVELLYELPEGIEIPQELYTAVADIYVFLYKTHEKLRNTG